MIGGSAKRNGVGRRRRMLWALWADAVATAAAATAAVSSLQPSSPSDAVRWTVRDEVSGSSEDISIFLFSFASAVLYSVPRAAIRVVHQ